MNKGANVPFKDRKKAREWELAYNKMRRDERARRLRKMREALAEYAATADKRLIARDVRYALKARGHKWRVVPRAIRAAVGGPRVAHCPIDVTVGSDPPQIVGEYYRQARHADRHDPDVWSRRRWRQTTDKRSDGYWVIPSDRRITVGCMWVWERFSHLYEYKQDSERNHVTWVIQWLKERGVRGSRPPAGARRPRA